MGRETQVHKTFLRSLLRDKTANTIAISAAALFPVMAMVGGGIDASRYYMAASRMQAACDSGALAARRAMTNDDFNAEHREIGENFFDQNYSEDMYGTEARTRTYTSDGDGVVTGTASGTLPTTIMAAFGYEEFNLSVTCSAEINISNSDIMFVLDVTGSMACLPDGSSCSSGSGSKIVSLREAVLGFYDTVESATSESAQVRYGFVPYSQQANVGFSLPTQYMATRHTYQSRVARFHVVNEWQVISDRTEWIPRNVGDFGSSDESRYRFLNRSGDPSRQNDSDYNLCEGRSGNTYTVGSKRFNVQSDEYRLQVWASGSLNDRAGCQGRVITSELRPVTRFRDYVYCPVDTDDATPCDVTNPADSPPGWETVNLSTLYDDNQIQLPTGNNGTMVNHIWGGCVEEAATVETGTYNPIPAGAYDIQINHVPASEGQRWKPALQNAVWERRDSGGTRRTSWQYTTAGQSRPSFACPREARKLAEINRTDLNTYVNSLNASGQTYHDIGMTWGARFISPRGIFAAENTTAPNGDAIARHIVFMTDGAQVNNVENYSTQGIEWWDRRITPDGAQATEVTRRAARLQAVCRAARQENITVWVVAFGTTLTQNLIDCASPGRAFQADDSATLNARFQEIAQKIAALRLTE